MPALRHGFEPRRAYPVDACRWCRIQQLDHMQRWTDGAGWHQWTPPLQQQILARMLARRTARLTTEPTRYHAATDWTGSSVNPDDEGEPMCADCRSAQCPQWLRIQARLDRQRWQLSGMPHGTATGGWGGDVPF